MKLDAALLLLLLGMLQEGAPSKGPPKGGPKIGERAPDFELRLLDSKETFKLSGNFGRRPTVLIFHSFT